METRFTEFSDIQVFVENIINLNGEDFIDTMYINTDAANLVVTILIEDYQGQSADFTIKKNDLQQVFDWLKLKQILS